MIHRRLVPVLVAAAVLLGGIRGATSGGAPVQDLAGTGWWLTATETLKVGKVGKRTTTPALSMWFGPMSANTPAPLNNLGSGEFELTAEDFILYLTGEYTQDGKKFTFTPDSSRVGQWYFDRLYDLPGVTLVQGASWSNIAHKGKVFPGGAGFKTKIKLKFDATLTYDHGDGPVNGIFPASLQITIVGIG